MLSNLMIKLFLKIVTIILLFAVATLIGFADSPFTAECLTQEVTNVPPEMSQINTQEVTNVPPEMPKMSQINASLQTIGSFFYQNQTYILGTLLVITLIVGVIAFVNSIPDPTAVIEAKLEDLPKGTMWHSTLPNKLLQNFSPENMPHSMLIDGVLIENNVGSQFLPFKSVVHSNNLVYRLYIDFFADSLSPIASYASVNPQEQIYMTNVVCVDINTQQ